MTTTMIQRMAEAKFDPGSPPYEMARTLLVRILRAIGVEEPRSGFAEMADDLQDGNLMQIPTWAALQACAAALNETPSPTDSKAASMVIDGEEERG